MVLYFYALDYMHDDEPIVDTELTLHAYMYSMGYKYQVEALKNLAKAYTADCLETIDLTLYELENVRRWCRSRVEYDARFRQRTTSSLHHSLLGGW